MSEIWKDIIFEENGIKYDYTGKYVVSSNGKIKNIKTNKILKQCICSGYFRVALYLKKKRKYFFVHRLVAYMFNNNENNYSYINHKDENKKNNNFDNLEWCSIQYNNKYGTHNKKIQTAMEKSMGKPVCQYTKNGVFIKEWRTIRQACRELKINPSGICGCLKNKKNYKTAGGFIWKYKTEYNVANAILGGK